MKLTGSKILLESLAREGVDTIFGYPGGTVINIYNDLMDSPIKHVLTRHEQGAVHAADGYARASGKVGVAIATSGPGATNTITGLATAYMDSIPMVVITGQVPTPLIGNDAFQ
ncbi:MAG: acetolactate synthase large subunit, partial [Desulfuromonadales bacterium]|nr:acetolactate synthase large subunit [Desulfuromonadales bacterium]